MTQAPLDPQMKMVLDMAAASGRPKMWTLAPAEAREMYRQTARILDLKPAPAVAEIVNRKLPGAAGELPTRLYRPQGAAAGDLLVFFHGGGYTIGDLETHDVPCRILATRANVAVLAIDYRLAPEHKFPAGVDDAVAVLRWVRANAASLGASPDRVAVGGDSAGGNLSTVACLRLRDAGEALPLFQLLIYPGTDFAADYESRRLFREGYFLEEKSMDYFRAHYISDADRLNALASPLRAKDLGGLPPAHVFTAAFDPLRDEGKAYADKMAAAGVKTSYRCVDGLVHGFLHFTGAVKAADVAMTDIAAAIRNGFGRS